MKIEPSSSRFYNEAFTKDNSTKLQHGFVWYQPFLDPPGQGSDKVIWETHKVCLHRVPNYGFGIAISGGKDNPHFSNGDPSIAVSDVLKAGPAENRLQINDRIVSVNGQSLEHVEHSDAITTLRESGSSVELVIRRKIPVPNQQETLPTKVTLQRRNKKDDYGLVLGCKFYIKEIVPNSLAAFDGTVKEGDTILKINNISVESLSLMDAKRQLEKAKERLQLTLKKPPRAPSVTNLLHKRQNSDLDYTKYPAQQSENTYQPEAQHEKPDYDKPRINSFVKRSESVLSPYRIPKSLPLASQSQYDVPSSQPLTPTRLPNPLEMSLHSPLYQSRTFFGGETRYISYNKEGGGAGLRIAGGNHTGIFIAGVQENSPADREGLSRGDEILQIDGHQARGMTREEAVMRIMSLDDVVRLAVQFRPDDFQRDLAQTGCDSGDRFFIRTHMLYEAPKGSNHLSFKPDDVFKVQDTLRSGVIGEWRVVKLDSRLEEVERGVIPNKARAEAIRRPQEEKEKPSKGSIFRRKSQKRSKSLGRDHWDDVIFAKELSKYPAYERVVLKEPGFRRPVVIYGPIADICRSKLISDKSDLYAVPGTDSKETEATKTGIIKLGAIRSVLDRNKHCILDVIPSAIDKLNYAQYYPVVLNVTSDRKELIKDIRAAWSPSAAKQTKKMVEQSQKIEKTYPHIFTKVLDLKPEQDWYELLRETIAEEQTQSIWMSEQKPTENLYDDFLFPMADRYVSSSSAAAGLDTDLEVSRTSEQLYSSSMVEQTADPDQNLELPPPLFPGVQYIRPPDSGYQSDHPIYSPQSTTSGVTSFSSQYSTPNSQHRHHHYHHRHHHKRERIKSDSRVPYQSSPYSSSYQSMDRWGGVPTTPNPAHTNGKSQARDRLNSSGDQSESSYSASESKHSHYSSHHVTKSPHDPYKSTRMTSSKPTDSSGSGSKPKPMPPTRSTSMKTHKELIFNRSDSIGSDHRQPTGHRRLKQSHSMDPSIESMRHYGDSGVGLYSSTSGLRRPSAPQIYQHSHTGVGAPRSRVNGHYAVPSSLMTQSVTEDDVFHATPFASAPTVPSGNSANGSFNNQLYMDSMEAADMAASDSKSPVQEPQRTTSTFESYKRFVTNKPFYGSANPDSGQPQVQTAKPDHLEPSAFESYKKSSSHSSGYRKLLSVRRGSAGALPALPPSRLEIEPTPDNHVMLDTVMGEVDSAGAVLSSAKTGVSIRVPPNAIPPGVKQQIYFKVCQQSNSLQSAIDQEKGERLLSPLVMCGPHGLKFQKPVELLLPHNVGEGEEGWNFCLKASDNDGSGSSAGASSWQSINLSQQQQKLVAEPSGSGNNQKCVSVLVNNF